MSDTYKKIHFDEDYEGGQKIIHKSIGVTDYNEFYYISNNGNIHLLLSCSDECLNALSELIENKGQNITITEFDKIKKHKSK